MLAALMLLASPIDALIAPLVTGSSPGTAVLVRRGGETVHRRGYGAAIGERSNFRLASLTKQFTAAAVMLLARDGKLRYDDTLDRFFPRFPAYGRAVTVRQLLTHTSGLPDYEALMDGGPWSAERQIQDAEVFQLLMRQKKGKFAGGTSWSYSNSGYVLLGLIVAKVSGEPLGGFLRRRIFEPLRMNGTVLHTAGRQDVPNRAYGHTRRGGGFERTDQSATSATQGDGGVYSNLVDLAKWDEALERHTLLSRDEFAPALTAAVLSDGSAPRWPVEAGEDNLNPGQPVSYGFGWFLDPYRGRRRMWHFGSTIGFRTAIHRFTGERLTVVVLCNRSDIDASALALQVAHLVLTRR
jgi:CubicO group peptidase (beta-lactamase class C family)